MVKSQGLFIHNGKLYESSGHYGSSKLMLLDVKDNVLQMVKSVHLERKHFGEGAEVYEDGDKFLFYQLTWRSRDMCVKKTGIRQGLQKIANDQIAAADVGRLGSDQELGKPAHFLYV
jgi:glutamine cyclotransferase